MKLRDYFRRSKKNAARVLALSNGGLYVCPKMKRKGVGVGKQHSEKPLSQVVKGIWLYVFSEQGPRPEQVEPRCA